MSDAILHITAMLCASKGVTYEGISVVDSCPDAVMPDDPACIPMQTTGSKYVELKMMPVDASAECRSLGEAAFECERGIEEDYKKNFIRRKNGLTFRFAKRPEDLCACGWAGMTITRRNLITCQDCAFISSTPAKGYLGVIPIDDSDPFRTVQEASYTVTDPECLPGEMLLLNWYMRMGNDVIKDQVGVLYFHTPAFTGGRILDIIDPDLPTRQLVVDVFGEETLTLTPSDFTDYSIGSWVYLMRCSSRDAFESDRQAAYQIDSSTGGAGGVTSSILELVNDIRRDNGLVQLTMNSYLCKSASFHAADMAENDFLSHTGSDGTAPIDRIRRACYLDGVGESVEVKTAENVAMGATSAQEVVDRWMNSPGHRANILDPMFREIGIAVDYCDQEWEIPEGKPYYVQNFGYRSDIAPELGKYRPVPIIFQPNGLLVDTSDWTPTLEFDLVGNFDIDFEAGYLEAVVTTVTQPAPGEEYGTADVTITTPGNLSGVTYNNLPILYHCPSRQTTVADGHKAFYAGDAVLVFNERGDKVAPTADDLSVIGLVDGIRPCFDCIVVVSLYYRPENDYKYVFVEISSWDIARTYKVYDGAGDEITQPFWGHDYDPAAVALQNGLVTAAATVDSGSGWRYNTTWVGPSSYNRRFDFYDNDTDVLLSSVIHDPHGTYQGFDVGFFKSPTSVSLPDDGTWLFDANEPHSKLCYTVPKIDPATGGDYWYESELARAETAFGISDPVVFMPKTPDAYWAPCSYHTSNIFLPNSFNDSVGGLNVSQIYAGKGISLFHYKAREIYSHYIAPVDDDVMVQSSSIFMVQANPAEEGGVYHYRWSNFREHDVMTEDFLYQLLGTSKVDYAATIYDWNLIKEGSVNLEDPDLAACYAGFGLQISQVYI